MVDAYERACLLISYIVHLGSYCKMICWIFVMKEKHMREIVLKAMGQAISKTVTIAEKIKVSALSPSSLFHSLSFIIYYLYI